MLLNTPVDGNFAAPPLLPDAHTSAPLLAAVVPASLSGSPYTADNSDGLANSAWLLVSDSAAASNADVSLHAAPAMEHSHAVVASACGVSASLAEAAACPPLLVAATESDDEGGGDGTFAGHLPNATSGASVAPRAPSGARPKSSSTLNKRPTFKST